VGGEGPSLGTDVLVDSVHCVRPIFAANFFNKKSHHLTWLLNCFVHSTQTGDMIALAEKLFNEHNWDIHLFALEHRYYGESVPSIVKLDQDENDSDSEDASDYEKYSDFTYLSSRQAVHDIAQFVKSPEAAMHLGESPENVRWIAFGGSYPGMLSAWSRLLFPDIIHGAVANSAPVQAELAFTQYYDHVASDLADEDVGGSEECQRIFVEGHEEIVSVLEKSVFPNDENAGTDPLDFIATLFNVCDGADALRESPRNIEMLIGDGAVRVPAQENDPHCGGKLCNIQKLCDAIVGWRQTDPIKSSMEILADINKIQLGDECNNVDWTMYIDYYSSPTPENLNDRSWLYQTCNEFGFYQTCQDDTKCPYSRGYHLVDRDLEFCQKVFGIDPDDVAKSVQSTLDFYGGWGLTPSADATGGANTPNSGPHLLGNEDQHRLLFVNGDVDPWTELAVTRLHGATNQLTVKVSGASHHFWTHEVLDTDGDEIAAARQQIYDTVSSWLGVVHSVFTAVG
jgi:serine protease 16